MSMSIFLIIFLCFIICGLLWVILMFPQIMDGFYDSAIKTKVVSSICILLFIGSPFVGVGIYTQNEKVYVQKYLAQKHTIEMSLASEELTGLERVQLVTKATELNGELAERKARFNLWHYVSYDNTIYKNIEFIDLGGGDNGRSD